MFPQVLCPHLRRNLMGACCRELCYFLTEVGFVQWQLFPPPLVCLVCEHARGIASFETEGWIVVVLWLPGFILVEIM